MNLTCVLGFFLTAVQKNSREARFLVEAMAALYLRASRAQQPFRVWAIRRIPPASI